MDFFSKEIDIDLSEFGCTLTFEENEHDFEAEMRLSVKELMNLQSTYILLQRTFPEDDFEDDYCSFEPSDFDDACELKDFIIELFPTRFEISINQKFYLVQFKEDKEKFEQINSALEIITNGKGSLTIHRTTD